MTHALPSRRRVLVVDDNIDAARIMSLVLEVAGHTVQTVHEAGAVLDTALRFRPDVALLDIGMPFTDGYELARLLRAVPELRQLTLVAVTGYGREEDVRRSREAGFDEHLTKPVSAQTVASVLERLPAH